MTTAQDPTLYVVFLSCPSAGLAGYIAKDIPSRDLYLSDDLVDAIQWLSESAAIDVGHWWAARVVPKGAEFTVEVRRYEP